VLALLALGGVLIFSFDYPGGNTSGAPEPADRRPSWFAQQTSTLLRYFPKNSSGVELRIDFVSSNLSDWQAAATSASSGGSINNGLLRPSGLRIWTDSRRLADYRFQFEGRIENTSVKWAIRADDHRNYYATKVMLSRHSSSSATELVRFSMIGGKETRRVRLPLPISLDDKAFYNYEVRATGDRFITIVGGRVVDTFRNPRLRTGGVGFFSEGSERASIRWAKVSTDDDFVEKLRGFLTLWPHPPADGISAANAEIMRLFAEPKAATCRSARSSTPSTLLTAHDLVDVTGNDSLARCRLALNSPFIADLERGETANIIFRNLALSVFFCLSVGDE